MSEASLQHRNEKIATISLREIMPQDFSGKNLRGRNFKGQNLTGAKFIGADIRGANFTNAILREADFTRAKAGLQRRWTIFLVTVSLFLSTLSGIACGFVGTIALGMLRPEFIQQYTSFPATIFLVLLGFFSVVITQQEFITAIVILAVALLFAASVFGAILGGLEGNGAGLTAIAGAVIGISLLAEGVTIAEVGVGTKAFVTSVGIAISVSIGVTKTVAVGAFGTGTGSVVKAVLAAKAVAGTEFLAATIAIVLSLLGSYIGWQTITEDEKYAKIRSIAVAIAVSGGTSFRNADLTDANFTEATVKSTDFRTANLTRTCFHKTEKLDRARVGNSILADTRVRELLITGNGYNKSYVSANLQGANLTGVNLNEANLKQANLNEATLYQANLEFANLTETQALATDFTAACFTGACLEAWNIDGNTKLDRADCRFVYLLEYPKPGTGDRDRRPHHINKCYEPGDFEKLNKKIMTTVQILLKDGINPEAFTAAFQKLMQEFPDITPESIQGFEKKEKDVLVPIEVPEGTDKGKVEQIWDEFYQARLEAQMRAEKLKSKDEIIALERHNYRVFQDFVIGLFSKKFEQYELLKLTRPPFNVNITNIPTSTSESKAMTQTNSNNITARDISQSTLNSDISGTVTNAINQLPASPQSDQPGIKELLTELQTAIEADTNLSDKNKAVALKQVKSLAEVGKNPQESTMQEAGETAMTMLKGILAGLPSAATLVEACSKLLPAIASLLLLP